MKLHTRMLAAVAGLGMVAATVAACGSSSGDNGSAAGTNGSSAASSDNGTSGGSAAGSSSSQSAPAGSSGSAAAGSSGSESAPASASGGSSAGSSAGSSSGSGDNDSAAGGGTELKGKTLTFGMVVPLTGPSAAIGPYMKNGAQLAVNKINANGGVLGAKIKLEAQDGACDAKSATTAANKLVSDEVTVSVGGYCSGATLPTLPIFNNAQIPMIIPAANSDDLVNEKLPLVFLINGTGTQQAQAAVKFMKKQNATKVALMDDNTSYSVNIADITEKMIGNGDGGSSMKKVAHDSVTAGENDYTADVNKILDTKPDFVYYTGYYQEAGLIVKELRHAGYKGNIMVGDGSVDAKLISIAGKDNAQGVFATMTQTPATIPGSEDWIASYKKAFNSDPGPYSTQAYDAVRTAAKAIEKAKSTKGPDIAKGLEAIDGFKLFSGPLKFTKKHTLSAGGFLILKVKGDKFVVADQLQG